MDKKSKQHFIDMKSGNVFSHSSGEDSDYHIIDYYKFLVDISANSLQLIYDSIHFINSVDHHGDSFFGDSGFDSEEYDLLFQKLLEYKIIEKFTVFDFWEDWGENKTLQVSPQ